MFASDYMSVRPNRQQIFVHFSWDRAGGQKSPAISGLCLGTRHTARRVILSLNVICLAATRLNRLVWQRGYRTRREQGGQGFLRPMLA